MAAAELSEYRPNVGVALFDRAGRVWYGRRVNQSGDPEKDDETYRWQMPQGGVDAGETPAEAAFRELHEETGVRTARLLLMTPGWLTYDFPPGYKRWKWRGQRQKWAVMLFDGAEAEIDLASHGKPEFDAWRWGELEEGPDLIVPFKRQVYKELAASLAPLRNYLRAGGR